MSDEQLSKRIYDLAMKLRQVGRVQIGRIFGSSLPTNGRYKAMIDLLERSYFLRAENNAVAAVLLEKKMVTETEWKERVAVEYEHLVREVTKEWPEIEFRSDGFTIKDPKAFHKRSKEEGWPP